MRIRPYTDDDWAELVAVYPDIWAAPMWDDVDGQVARDELGEILAYDSTVALVADVDGALAGLAVAYDVARRDAVPDRVLAGRGGAAAYLDEVGVVPAHRHERIGTALLETLLDRIRPDYDAVVLRTHPDAADAVRLYEHHGFAHTGVHDDERPERVYMVKEWTD